MYKIANKVKDLTNKVSHDDVTKIAGVFRKIIPDPKIISGTGTTLTNNEIKDIMKVSKSLENRVILLKWTTRKTTSQEGGFFGFLKPLMTAVLPLMKNVRTPIANSVLIPLGLQQQHQQQMKLFKRTFLHQLMQH